MFENGSRRKGHFPSHKEPIKINQKDSVSDLNDFINSEKMTMKLFRETSGKPRYNQPISIPSSNMDTNKEFRTSMEKFSFNKPASNNAELADDKETSSVNKFEGIHQATKFGNNKSRPITPMNELNISKASSANKSSPIKNKPFVIKSFGKQTAEHNPFGKESGKIEHKLPKTKTSSSNPIKLDLNINAKDLLNKNALLESNQDLIENKKQYDGKLIKIEDDKKHKKIKEEVVHNDEEEYDFDDFEKDNKLLSMIEENNKKMLNDEEEEEFGKGQEFINLEEEELRQPILNEDNSSKRERTLKRLKDLKGVIELSIESYELFELSNNNDDTNISSKKEANSNFKSVGVNTNEM